MLPSRGSYYRTELGINWCVRRILGATAHVPEHEPPKRLASRRVRMHPTRCAAWEASALSFNPTEHTPSLCEHSSSCAHLIDRNCHCVRRCYSAPIGQYRPSLLRLKRHRHLRRSLSWSRVQRASQFLLPSARPLAFGRSPCSRPPAVLLLLSLCLCMCLRLRLLLERE